MLTLLFLTLPVIGFGLPATNQDVPKLMEVISLRSSAVCCSDLTLKSCATVTVNPKILGVGSLKLPRGEAFSFSNTIAPNPNSYYYKSEVGEVILVHNPKTGGMHGHAMLATGESFVLENCGMQGHVWKEQDVTAFVEEEHMYADDEEEVVVVPDYEELVQKGQDASNRASASYSVKFYYTPAMGAVTPDLEGFTDLAIAETNQGYANSEIDTTVYRLCIEEATIEEIEDSSDFFYAFFNMKGSPAELRETADQTTLLSLDFHSCGIGRVNGIAAGTTVTVAQKKCAVGYYSFGHEIGHNYGCAHNPEQSTNNYYPYGHGHLILKGQASDGYRSVLAYTAPGHSTRVNYYSNPDIIFPTTGTATGVVGLSNNARVINENRFAMEQVGDESGCKARK